MVHFSINATMARVLDDEELDEMAVTDSVGVCIGRFNARSTAKVGDTVDVAVDCSRLQFFDAASGVAI